MASLFLSAALFFAAEGYATLDGDRVHYVNHGAGKQALVFIHGWTCDHSFWKVSPKALGNRRLVLIDLPGHGSSDKPQIAYTQTHMARAVDAVLRGTGVEKAVLVGHSMGVATSAQFLKLYPEKVSALVMVDGMLPRGASDAAARVKFVERFSGPGYAETAAKMIESMFTDRTTPELREEIRTKMLATPQHVGQSAMEKMADLERPAKIDVPVLVLQVARPNAKAYEEFLRGFVGKLEFQAWDGFGHFLMMEDPVRFQKEMAGFLERQGL